MKKAIELIDASTSYKLIIPTNVERKIRILCREIHNIEWSGILFYKVEGSFKNNDLVITCTDLYQMDIGNSSYTEYTITPEVSTYMLDHDLLDHYIGHIHSHHNMNTFFSNTDNQELIDGGSNTNHFLSLIVNNKGDYTAAITRKLHAEREIVEDYTYKSFNDIEYHGETTYTNTDIYLEKFKLDIEVHKVEEPTDEVLERIKELKKIKEKKPISLFPNTNYSSPSTLPRYDYKNSLFTQEPTKEDLEKSPLEYDYSLHIDKGVIESIVKKLLTCSVIITSTANVDINKWATNLNKLYTNIFKDVPTFESFATNHVDFILSNIDDYNLDSITNDGFELTSVVAYNVIEYLETLPKNVWIDKYISILSDYLL